MANLIFTLHNTSKVEGAKAPKPPLGYATVVMRASVYQPL